MFLRNFSPQFNNEELITYRHRLPAEIGVAMHEAGGKFFAHIEFSGVTLTTQARRPQELYDMVNDTVYTYFEIPRQYIPLVSRYAPPKELVDRYGINLPAEKIVFRAV